ncbi:EamA family transporter [Clostridiaceae bacterium OttesenSCG-928-D20]|nr:EamA family transporter [Clostridiaceae bacterium OttesenSCG-928-D20]
MWFTYSILTIILWGGSDLFSKWGTRPADKYSHHRLAIAVGTVMGLHALYTIFFTGIDFHPSAIITYLPVSLMYILSMVLGYAGLRYIELSVSSPICNSSGAVSAILAFIFLGQWMNVYQFIGVALISFGIVFLAVAEKKQSEIPKTDENKKYRLGFIAIMFPILYCIIDGVGITMDAWWLENLLDEDVANTAYELSFAIYALCVWIYLKFIRKEDFSYIREKKFMLGAVCETGGQFFYIYALSDNAIVAAPMIASYSIFSVVLSRIILKEKLSVKQYAIIAVVMLGIAILGIFDV